MLKSGVVLFNCMVNDMKIALNRWGHTFIPFGFAIVYMTDTENELSAIARVLAAYLLFVFAFEQFDTYLTALFKVIHVSLDARIRAKHGLTEPTEEQNRLLAEAEEIVNRTKAQLEQSKKDDIRLHEIKQRIAAIDIERAK